MVVVTPFVDLDALLLKIACLKVGFGYLIKLPVALTLFLTDFFLRLNRLAVPSLFNSL